MSNMWNGVAHADVANGAGVISGEIDAEQAEQVQPPARRVLSLEQATREWTESCQELRGLNKRLAEALEKRDDAWEVMRRHHAGSNGGEAE